MEKKKSEKWETHGTVSCIPYIFMQIAISIMSILIFCSLAAAVECKSELIGITVYFYSQGKEWATTWKTDGVYKIKSDYSRNRKWGERTNVFESDSLMSAKSLPQNLLSPGKQFHVPFDISRHGEFLISAIYENNRMWEPSKKFAIVDLQKQRIVKIINTEYYGIKSLAWSPDGKYFAVLYPKHVTEQVFKGPIDWIAGYLGHSIHYWTFYLTIYQSDGTMLCTKKVAEKLPDTMSYIDWTKEGKATLPSRNR